VNGISADRWCCKLDSARIPAPWMRAGFLCL
jgi:hypothetical protein